QGHRQRSGADPGLDDGGTGVDVAEGDDESRYLRVHDSGTPRHRQHEVLIARAEDLAVHSPGDRYDDSLMAPDDVIVADEPLVRVERLLWGEHERVHSPLVVGELDLFATGQDARGTGSECLSHDESTLRWRGLPHTTGTGCEKLVEELLQVDYAHGCVSVH